MFYTYFVDFQILTITFATLLHVTVAVKKLPFTCPNKVPNGLSQPSQNIHNLEEQFENQCKEKECTLSGLSPNINASNILFNSVYAQFQAASALVPCDEKPVSVFIPKTLIKSNSNPHDRYSVAVVYTEKSSTYAIKKWLK